MKLLEMWGHRARVVIELDIGEGRTVSVPVTDHCTVVPIGIDEDVMQIRLHGAADLKIAGALDDVGFRGLDR